jgi:hypothetical protein
MENQFDDLTRALAVGIPRRQALRRLAGLFGSALVTALTLGGTAHAETGVRCSGPNNKHLRCPTLAQCCNGFCCPAGYTCCVATGTVGPGGNCCPPGTICDPNSGGCSGF